MGIVMVMVMGIVMVMVMVMAIVMIMVMNSYGFLALEPGPDPICVHMVFGPWA